jgi:hypothetical protein
MSSDIHRNEQGTHIILILNGFVVSNGAAPWAWDLVYMLLTFTRSVRVCANYFRHPFHT